MKFFNKLLSFFFVISLLTTILLTSCSKQTEPPEKILVKIGDKTISVNEFIRRAEYTVRPVYCNGSNNLHKKVVLNSLIAEKLMAIEAGDTNSFISNKNIEDYLRGRKEQDMRKWLYEEEALQKVELDTTLVEKTFKVAGRKYKISFFNLPNNDVAQQVKSEIEINNTPFKEIFNELTGLDSLPRREVEWSPNENPNVIDSLYSAPLKKGQIVGPVQVAKDQFMMIKIDSWTNQPAISELQTQERWRNISESFQQREATKLFDKYIHNLMQGKKIEFERKTFFRVADLLGPFFIKSAEEKQNQLKKSFWEEDEDFGKYQDLQTEMEALYREPLFKVNAQVWTVKDFVDELVAHPLVFRNNDMKKNEFGQQLQFAIMDLVRDKFMSQVAYKRGYDKKQVIKRNFNTWRDNLNYLYYKNKLLAEAIKDSSEELHYMQVIEKYLDVPVDSLQKKYADKIEIDVEEFNKIELTRIDMNVIEKNVPFPRVVPSFPLVTTDNALDYGRKMGEGEVN